MSSITQADQSMRMQSDESYDEPHDDREDVDVDDVSSTANRNLSVSWQNAPPPLSRHRELTCISLPSVSAVPQSQGTFLSTGPAWPQPEV